MARARSADVFKGSRSVKQTDVVIDLEEDASRLRQPSNAVPSIERKVLRMPRQWTIPVRPGE